MSVESTRESPPGEWVLLTYRMPREPSAPRLALWRKIKRLGAAQLADGLVALPADARTREQLEWAAGDVEQAGGTAGVWFARPATVAQEQAVAAPMNAARAAEYAQITEDAHRALGLAGPERTQVLRKLRTRMRQIERRDFFRPAGREQARQALRELTQPSDTQARVEAAP